MAAQTSAPMMAFGCHPWGQSPKQEGCRAKMFSLAHHNPGFKKHEISKEYLIVEKYTNSDREKLMRHLGVPTYQFIIQTMGPKEMGILLGISCWEKEKVPATGETCVPKRDVTQS